jgi:hypothetical protein
MVSGIRKNKQNRDNKKYTEQDISCRHPEKTLRLSLSKIDIMILEILRRLEMDVEDALDTEKQNLVAIKQLKTLMNEIDHDAEEVPLTDKNRFAGLLASLKGRPLNDAESKMVDRIIKK